MSFPTTIKPSSISVASNRPNTIFYTLSGKRSINQFASQYFTLTVNMPLMTNASFQEYKAFLISKKGGFSTFTFEYPVDNEGADKSNTSVAARSAHSVGDTTIDCDGFSASTNDALRAGDFIKFNSHNKVYTVVSDVDSNSGGEGTITIEPPLQAAVADNEAVDVNKPVFTVALNQDDVLYTTSASNLYTLSFEIREVI